MLASSVHGFTTSSVSTATLTRYEQLSDIGRGAYSAVYRGRDLNNEGRYVAMKEVRIQLNSEEGIPMTTVREIGLLRQLEKYNHENVVKLLDVVSGRRTHRELHLNLIFEHIDQDLAQYLEKCPAPGLGPERIQDLMYQILSGVDFIHTHRIVHRDLKPQNILVTSSGQVKLADFGLARIYGFTMALTSVVVTLYYRAPEVLLQDQYCAAVDIWSCGCIFAELHTRKALFAGSSEIDQLCKIFEVIGLPSEEDWPDNVSLPRSSFRVLPPRSLDTLIPNMQPEAKELIQKMLTFSQTLRISASEALKHVYFDDRRVEPSSRSHDRSQSLSSSSEPSSAADSSFYSEDDAPDNGFAVDGIHPISSEPETE